MTEPDRPDLTPVAPDFTEEATLPPLRAGQIVFGQYKLLKLIRAGRYATVWEADETCLERVVLLRFIPHGLIQDQMVMHTLKRLFSTLMVLDHPSIARIYGWVNDDQRLAIIEEQSCGTSLADLQTQQAGGTFSIEQISEWLGQCVSVLECAHREGLAHGAICPEDILVQPGAGRAPSRIKLVNFGIEAIISAALIRLPGWSATDEGIAHLSPAQLLARWPKPADDVFSLGAVLYDLLSGCPPFHHKSRMERLSGARPAPLAESMKQSRVWPRDETAFVPYGWEPLIMRCLAEQPSERPSLREIGEMLRPPLSHSLVIPQAGPSFLGQDQPEPGADARDDTPAEYPPENVQFTVYRPRAVSASVWRKLLVYTHLDDGPPDQPTPREQVRADVQNILGSELRDYTDVTKDSRTLIPRDAEIQLVPKVEGVRFNPPSRSFFWVDGIDMHREEFGVRALSDTGPEVLKGTLTIYLGVLIVAEVSLQFQRVAALAREPANLPADTAVSSVKPYRNIFPSYSRRDDAIVRQVEDYAKTFGDRFLKDVTMLRAGEEWSPRLYELIESADVFQLFWSANSARSHEVEKEWRHALTLRKSNFIRPTYWEDPIPDPPQDMGHLHFQRLVAQAGFKKPEDPPQELHESMPLGPPPRASSAPSFSSRDYQGHPKPSQSLFGSSMRWVGEALATAWIAITRVMMRFRRRWWKAAALATACIAITGLMMFQSSPSPTLPAIDTPTSSARPMPDEKNIEIAELGFMYGRRFTPQREISLQQALTVRLQTRRDCHVRAFYVSADKKVVNLIFPPSGGSLHIQGKSEFLMRNFRPFEQRTVSALSQGSDVITSMIVIQVSDEEFSLEGVNVRSTSPRFPFDNGVWLSALTKGVPSLHGLSARESREKLESIVEQWFADLTTTVR